MYLLQHPEPFCFGTPCGQDWGALGPPNVGWVSRTHKHTTPIIFGRGVPVAPPILTAQQGFAHAFATALDDLGLPI